MWQMPNSPWPPVCLTFLPSPRADADTVSRNGTRSSTLSTATPYRDDSRSSSTSAWASPMHHSTSWWVSAFISSRMVGSSATSRGSAADSLSSSAFDRATNATGSSGSGIDHGSISSGCSLDESVSPVSAVDSFATAHTEPAGHDVSGRCSLPSGVGQRADPLVVIVVGVPAGGPPVPGHVHRRVRRERAGEHPHQRDAPHVGVGGGLHHLGEQRPVGVAGQPGDRRPVDGGRHRRQRVLERRRQRLGDHLEQLREPDPERRGDREHRVERPARDRLLQVGDQHEASTASPDR